MKGVNAYPIFISPMFLTHITFIGDSCMMQRYLNVMDHFGYRNQMKKLHEEVFELNEAIDNYEDYLEFGHPANDIVGKNIKLLLREHIVEEMGDVLSICTQFIGKYDITEEEINHTMDCKLERTEDRIEGGYYDEKK